jgi:hypothetical protein
MTTQYERDLKRAEKVVHYWHVSGCSRRKGRTTLRDGKAVTCGHQHQTEEECQPCVKKMRQEKPGNCQDYRPAQMTMMVMKK